MCCTHIILYRYCGHINFHVKNVCEHYKNASSFPSSNSNRNLEKCNLQYYYNSREIADGCPGCYESDGLAATFAMRKYMEAQIDRACGSANALTVEAFRQEYESSWLSRWSDGPASASAPTFGTRRGKEPTKTEQREPGLWRQDVNTIGWFRRVNKLATFQETEPRFLSFAGSWLARRQAPPARPSSSLGSDSNDGTNDDTGTGSDGTQARPTYQEWRTKRYDMYCFTKWVKEEISQCRCAWGPARVVARQHFWEWMEWRKSGKKGSPPVRRPKWVDENKYYGPGGGGGGGGGSREDDNMEDKLRVARRNEKKSQETGSGMFRPIYWSNKKGRQQSSSSSKAKDTVTDENEGWVAV